MPARDRILSIASPLGLLIVWKLAARLGIIDTRFFPAPSSIFATVRRDAENRASS